MTALTVTAAKVSISSDEAVERNYIAKVALTAGLPVFIDGTTGKVDICDGNGSGTKQFRGITLNPAGIGQGVRVLEYGDVDGFDLSGLSYDAPVYISDTAGSLDTAAGTVTVVVGRVAPKSDNDLTKTLRVQAQLAKADWA